MIYRNGPERVETDRNGLTKIPKRTSSSTETGLNKGRVGQGMYMYYLFCTSDTMDFFLLVTVECIPWLVNKYLILSYLILAGSAGQVQSVPTLYLHTYLPIYLVLTYLPGGVTPLYLYGTDVPLE